MTKEQIVQGYLMNSPKVVAEMLYETIERYENRSCESCKKFEQWYCASGSMNVGTCKDEENSLNIFEDNIDNEIPSSFCCNKWELK